MFKNLSLPNKETLVIVSIGLITGLLLLVNLAVFIPTLIDVYQSNPQTTNKYPIDVESVNEAIEYISP